MIARIVINICLIIIIICHNSECKNKMLKTLRTCHNNIGKFSKHIKPLLKTKHSRNFWKKFQQDFPKLLFKFRAGLAHLGSGWPSLASGQFKQPFLTYFCPFLTNSLAKFAICAMLWKSGPSSGSGRATQNPWHSKAWPNPMFNTNIIPSRYWKS